jgi:hypothetical protein
MIGVRTFAAKAGSPLNLPFFLFGAFLLLSVVAGETAEMKPERAFTQFKSSCIDLGSYDAKAKQLTVRFVNRNPGRFYCYSNVPSSIWTKLRTLNKSGGVGEYLNEAVVQRPEKYPFREIKIREFTKASETKKSGDSK